MLPPPPPPTHTHFSAPSYASVMCSSAKWKPVYININWTLWTYKGKLRKCKIYSRNNKLQQVQMAGLLGVKRTPRRLNKTFLLFLPVGQSCYISTLPQKTLASNRRKEGNVLFNDALNIFFLRLYGVRHMVKDHSDSKRGNPLLPHGLLFPISSKGSLICTIPQTG